MADTIPSIIKPKYYPGQLLKVEDFNREQDFHVQYRNLGNQQLLSAGVLSGLTADGNGASITATPGAAIDANGQYILLTTNKTYIIIEADGEYQLVISYHTVDISGTNNQQKSDPTLSLVANGASINNGVLLATVTVVNKMVSKLEAAASPVQILPSRIPRQSVQNLDASVITTGIFGKDHIPGLQNLNGRLTLSQLPDLPDNGEVIMRNSFTAGVLNGLTVNNTAKIVQVTGGIAVDASGALITLANRATYKNTIINAQQGIFSLDMSDAAFQDKTWLLQVSQNTADAEAPILEFLENSGAITDKLILATIKVVAGLPNASTDGRDDVLLTAVRLPHLTSDLIPDIQNLKGKIVAAQLPDLQDMEGILIPGQIPELQNLRGQLTVQQLPADMEIAKNYLTFFVSQPIIGSGSEIQFSWKALNGVDSLSLSYFSENGINNHTTDIKLTEPNFPLTPSLTTTFTLTARINNSIVDQKQLTVTVFTVLELAQLQFNNQKSAAECLIQIIRFFPQLSALESAIALAKTGYTAIETATALKASFPNLTSQELTKIFAAAYGSTTAISLAKADKAKGFTAMQTGEDIILHFQGITAVDFAAALATATYTSFDTAGALKKYIKGITPDGLISALYLAYGSNVGVSFAKHDRDMGFTAIETGKDLISFFATITPMDFSFAISQAGYESKELAEALKVFFPKLSPEEIVNIFRQNYK